MVVPQLKLGVAIPVRVKGKGPKGNHFNREIVFTQDIDPKTRVDIGTEINISYYPGKED